MAQFEPLDSRRGMLAGSFSMVVGVMAGGGDETVDIAVGFGEEGVEIADRGINELVGLVFAVTPGPIT